MVENGGRLDALTPREREERGSLASEPKPGALEARELDEGYAEQLWLGFWGRNGSKALLSRTLVNR